MKTVLLLKIVFNNYFRIYKKFIAFYYYLLQIKAFSLFQKFKKNLYKIFSISVNLFIFFYPKIEKQSEIANQKIKKRFCTFVNYQLDNLKDKLLMIEFVANNNQFISTKLSLFFILKSLHLYISLDIIDFLDITIYKQINKKKTINILKAI